GENLAYMIYTSGSTGKPKGALNTHAGIFNRLYWMQSEYRLTPDDRVLQKTPFSFDVSVWEFFLPLMFGARLVVAKPEGHKDPQYLVDLIQRESVTTLHFVPSMLYPFLETRGVSDCASVRRVICSGEALPVELANRFFKVLRAELHNLYGPTEAAVDVSHWTCHPGESRHSIPLGRPVANTRLYVLDEHLQPTPIGIPGELHIAGIQVGRGYLNRPELTAEKYVKDPFHGGRMYKTGDLCRIMPDGNIEFLGRLDFQVKIRGFRIELGEIESVLAKHLLVRQAVVAARKETNGQHRLVAYFTAVENAGMSRDEIAADVRAFLKKELPDYMIPAFFVLLDAMPLNANG
ncbi:MAG TPA: amino acid adenylation domain-containing protein, partial [Anaerolineales bacterium]|nr:amino acid adenylation domain-containing protein [Anaerolineales bacterium]